MDKKLLKIAIIVRNYVTHGGMERYVVETTSRLREKGHEIHLFCQHAEQNLANGMITHKVPIGCNLSSAFSRLSFAMDCKRMLKDESFHIIHSHEMVITQDLATLHTFSYTGSLLHRYPAWRMIDKKWLSYRSWIYQTLEKKQKKTARLVTVSQLLKVDIKQNFSVNRVDVIEPGVDTKRFTHSNPDYWRQTKRTELGVSDNELLVLFVGSEFKRKGLDRLIPAIGRGMRLLVLGSGQKTKYFHNLANTHGISESVTFQGLVKKDIEDYYAAADLLVLPSRREAFGMVVLEGMASGLPVVVSREVGAAALISNGKDGFVFTDTSDLINILNLLTDKFKRKTIGKAARKKAEQYSWNAQVDKYEKIYYEIASEKIL